MKIAIIGYGKMGREIERIALARGHEVAAIIDPAADAAGAAAAGGAEAGWAALALGGADVAVEFTHPDAALGNITRCLETGVPVVCGTTAWTARLPEVKSLCEARGGAFFYASNYSVGVNVVFELNRRLAELMDAHPEFDVTVEETHHTEKKDAPSGTAITLAEDIVARVGRKSTANLQVVSTRRGVATGTHTVIYESESDIITLRHDIKNRSGLAMGAVLAAEFLVGKKGVFTMSDLLQL